MSVELEVQSGYNEEYEEYKKGPGFRRVGHPRGLEWKGLES